MIRAVAFIVLILLIGGCSGGLTPAPSSEKTIHAVVDIPSQTKMTLQADTKVWMEKYFTAESDPILYYAPSEGVVVGNGQIAYPCSWLLCATKGDLRVSFEMNVRMHATEIETVFRNIQLISPSSGDRPGMVGPVWSQRDIDAIRPKLMELHQGLILYLNRLR
jgi:hypothetical protein